MSLSSHASSAAASPPTLVRFIAQGQCMHERPELHSPHCINNSRVLGPICPRTLKQTTRETEILCTSATFIPLIPHPARPAPWKHFKYHGQQLIIRTLISESSTCSFEMADACANGPAFRCSWLVYFRHPSVVKLHFHLRQQSFHICGRARRPWH